ncbi:MAG: oligosaccharide flippase family protein [Carnobacterium sp.]|uniref:oligosaccharide flippase family protein n=1 Tax=Carnobacterium sp. TaxID=48221 RepID=UPI003314961A
METLRSVFRVAVANFFSLGSSFIIGFILPVYISTYDYGKYKEFILYLSFVFIFNLGFNDGIYIKYGGRNKESIDVVTLNSEVRFLKFFQGIIFSLIFLFAVYKHDSILIYFSLATLFTNLIQFHKNFLQAIGNFKLYSKLNIYNTIFNVLLMLIAIFVISDGGYLIFIFSHVFALFLTYLFYEYNYYIEFKKGLREYIKLDHFEILNLFKIGIIILFSNMIVSFIASIGSWFVNFNFSTKDFAQYSFSTSLLNILLLIVNAISLVFFNLIAKNENEKMLINLKKVLLLLGIFGGLGYFVFSFIIINFISKYTPALGILSITFISIPYIMVSNVVFINLYKTRNNNKQYLIDMLLFLALAASLITFASVFFTNMGYIALATTFSYILWYFLVTNFKFRYLKDGNKERLLIISHILFFYMCVNILSFYHGLIVYIIYLLFILCFYKNDLKNIMKF